MKIAPRAAEAYLAKPEARSRALLLYGPDSGLVRQRAKKTAAAVLAGNTDPFASVELSEAMLLADPARLADELAAMHMMAPKRVIMMRDAGDKSTRLIEEAASHFHDSVFLIVTAGELTARSSLRTWFEKRADAAALACYQDEMRDVQEVIRRAFDGAGIHCGREVTDYLAQQLGNDRGVTSSELEKLILFAGDGKTLLLEDAQVLVDYNRETGFDELANAVADRNMEALEKTLSLLQREGSQPVAYLRILQRYFNRLYYIKGHMQAGMSAEQAVQNLKPPVFFRQAPYLTRHAQSWSMDQVIKALKLLAAAELACKTSDLPPLPASGRRLLQLMQIR